MVCTIHHRVAIEKQNSLLFVFQFDSVCTGTVRSERVNNIIVKHLSLMFFAVNCQSTVE